LGVLDEALRHGERALALDPNHAECHFHVANLLGQKGRFDEAIAHYRQALGLKPHYAKAHVNLGIALLGRGQLDAATDHFQRALAIEPEHVGARQNLGAALEQQGRIAEALACWREVLRVQPNQLAVLNRCAWILATDADPAVRNAAEAVALAERAVQLSGGRDPAILDTLAAAYAEAGRFQDALRVAQTALDQAAASGNAAPLEGLRARTKLYQAGSPFRQSNSGRAGTK
jgi:spermidine synthase